MFEFENLQDIADLYGDVFINPASGRYIYIQAEWNGCEQVYSVSTNIILEDDDPSTDHAAPDWSRAPDQTFESLQQAIDYYDGKLTHDGEEIVDIRLGSVDGKPVFQVVEMNFNP